MTKVSVIIPNYNHASFLEQRIITVLNQTYQDFEIIFLDDASADNSLQIFSKYSNHPKISHALLNQINSGSPFKQWKKGLDCASGDYIWIAESDDYCDSAFLENLVPYLDNNPNVGLVYCQSLNVDSRGKTLQSTLDYLSLYFNRSRWEENYVNNGRAELKEVLIYKNSIQNTSSAIFCKNLVQQVWSTEENFRFSGDWLLWCKICLVSDIAYVKDPLNYFRQHPTKVTSTSAYNGTLEKEGVEILIDIANKFPSLETEARESCKTLIYNFLSKDSLSGSHLSYLDKVKILYSLLQLSPSTVFILFQLLWEETRERLARLRFHMGIRTKIMRIFNLHLNA